MDAAVQGWMQQAFYPALFGVLVIASLGLPIPEDIPLMAAGVLLRTHPGIASWSGTIIVALIGIMIGDLVLYTLGRRWGPEVFKHRTVRWMVTPKRFARFSEEFHRHGAWACFVGRFFVGVRAAMCLTAGATRFPYGRFFLADFSGALLSVPFFVGLGYFGAQILPQLQAYVGAAEAAMLLIPVTAIVIVVLLYRRRQRRRLAARRAARTSSAGDVAAACGAAAGDAELTGSRPAVGGSTDEPRSAVAGSEVGAGR